MRRRQFIRNGALALSPVLLPSSLLDLIGTHSRGGKHKVFIHLKGGNDWYNTIVPLDYKTYDEQRSSLLIDKAQLVYMNEYFGFNPSLQSFSDLYSNNNLRFIERVTQVPADVSHYTSEVAWKELCGIPEPADAQLSLGSQLDIIGKAISSSGADTVYSAELDGFDTHQFQRAPHDLLLRELAESLKGFIDNLKDLGLFRDTLIVIWTEFGRSLPENIRKGTDHGEENSLLLIGGKLSEWKDGDLFKSTDGVVS